MAETSVAFTVVSKENKRIKSEEEHDLISSLPDSLIQHILSFLPSIQDAIGTAILSKRWLNQWTSVPVVIFRSTNGTSIKNFPNFIDNALNLYKCSKINKFEIDSYHFSLDELRLKLPSWVRFATSRDVKELILNCNPDVEMDDQFYDPAFEGDDEFYKKYEPHQIPQFLFNNAFLVKLKTHYCLFRPEKGNVNWKSLKALYIGSSCLTNEGIENVLSGSPVLEYLELHYGYGFQQIDDIAKISITSKSLKTFRMHNSMCFAFEISCPNLDKLELGGSMRITSLKFRDLPASVSVTLDFKIGKNDSSAADKLKLVEEFLLQVQHVEELKLGPCLLKILSFAAVGAKSSLSLNCKCLIVFDPFSAVRQPGLPISYLRCSSLEKLVIHQCLETQFHHEEFMKEERKFWEMMCWKVDWSVFDNLVSHLKTIEIVGLTYRADCGSSNDVLNFVTFLLKNARLLEKMVLLEYSEQEMDLAHEVCKKLSCIQKASPHAIVKVACLKWHDSDSDYDWDKIVY